MIAAIRRMIGCTEFGMSACRGRRMSATTVNGT
jgi:hypothetical protein